MNIFIGLLIPVLGTTFGSAMVFLMKNKIDKNIEKILSGFAAGVMIAASVWSLLIPSIDMTKNSDGQASCFPAAIGFVIMMILDVTLG